MFVKKLQDDWEKSLSKDMVSILHALLKKDVLDTNDVVNLQRGNKGSRSSTRPEDMTPAQLKVQRNTARKTAEKLAARGLITIEKVPNLAHRMGVNGELHKGAFGFIMKYRLTKGTHAVVDAFLRDRQAANN